MAPRVDFTGKGSRKTIVTQRESIETVAVGEQPQLCGKLARHAVVLDVEIFEIFPLRKKGRRQDPLQVIVAQVDMTKIGPETQFDMGQSAAHVAISQQEVLQLLITIADSVVGGLLLLLQRHAEPVTFRLVEIHSIHCSA